MTAKTLAERAAAENATNGSGELDESRAVFFANGFKVGDEFEIPYFTEGNDGTLCTQYFLNRGEKISDFTEEELAKKPKAFFVIVNVKNKALGITTKEQVANNAKRLYPTLFHRSRDEWKRDEFGIKATGKSYAPSGEPARDFLSAGNSMEAAGFRAMRGYYVRVKSLKEFDGASFERDRLQTQRVAELEYIGYIDIDGNKYVYGKEGWISPVVRAAKYPKILEKVASGEMRSVFSSAKTVDAEGTGAAVGEDSEF